MNLLSKRNLDNYFANRNNPFANSKGMQISWHDEWGVHTSFPLPLDDARQASYELHIVTSEGLDDFIENFIVKSIEDINQLDYDKSQVRYLNGNAEILVTSMELEASFSFRIYKSLTTVASIDLHFYDECYRHLTTPNDFFQYFSNNEHRLHAAAANRYRL